MTPHNSANKDEITKTVLMPGDPQRAEYIAKNFLDDYKLISSIRNMTAYTGYYKGKKITVFPHGMGMPSVGIYVYELFKFYDVENIIRIGTCGAYNENLNIFDTILADKSYTIGNFAKSFNGIDEHIAEASKELNNKIENEAKSLGFNLLDYNALINQAENNSQDKKLILGNVICSEIFDYYVEDMDKFIGSFPKDLNIIASEMESFALFYLAKYFKRNASTLLTVVDNHYKKQEITAEERVKSLNNMITIALETAIKL